MRKFKDTRGRSWFDIVSEMDYQVDITYSYPGTVRAFHYHKKKIEWMFVIKGHYKFVLTNPKEILYLSEGEIIKINPKRWHGYQNLGTEEGLVMEIANKKHDVKNPDDYRKPYNKYDKWEKELK
jgi:dTDP-4-dehydrorhamnose 3,5-epimerase